MCTLLPSAIADSIVNNDDPGLLAVCKETLCRKPKFNLKLDENNTKDWNFEAALPFLQNNFIVLFPSETLFVEAEISAAGEIIFSNPSLENKNPEKTIEFNFLQVTECEKCPTMMVLKISNPFAFSVKFDMGIMKPGSNEVFKTSSCPVREQRISYEAWPEPIFQIVIGRPRKVDSEKTPCS